MTAIDFSKALTGDVSDDDFFREAIARRRRSRVPKA